MKPLTIDELKALQVGDWVWIIHKQVQPCYGKIMAKHDDTIYFSTTEGLQRVHWKNYGNTWLTYKNKEQAETKGEWVELICNVGDTIYYVAPKGVFPCPVTRVQFTRGLTSPDELIIEIMYEQGDEITAPVYKELSGHSYGTLWFTDEAKAEQHFKKSRGLK